MQPAPTTASVSPDRPSGVVGGEDSCGWAEDRGALTARRLAELERLLEAGMGTARLINRCIAGELSLPETKALIGGGSVATELVRVSRAVRQVIVLEQELTGLRPAPDRDAELRSSEAGAREASARETGAGDSADSREPSESERDRPDPNDIDDYDKGPLDQVIARIRKAVRLAAPADDPFAPPPGRKRRDDAPAVEVVANEGPARRPPADAAKADGAQGAGAPSAGGSPAARIMGARPHPRAPHPFAMPPKPAIASPSPEYRSGRHSLLGGAALTALGGAVRDRGPPR